MIPYTKKCKKHSTTDWDFSSAAWELDPVTYHSAPSSFHCLSTALLTFIKTSVVPISKVKQGEFRTYIINLSGDQSFEIWFRYQDPDNYYGVRAFTSGYPTSIFRKKAGVVTTLRTITSAWWTPGVWHGLRVIWWESNGVLWIRFLDGSTKILPDASDAQNNWAAIGGRVGFGGYSTLLQRVDDTVIYGSP